MGAAVETTDGHAPLVVEGGELQPIRWELPVASAQVKSCVLLAGLYAEERAGRRRSSRTRAATTPSACSRRWARGCGGSRGEAAVWPAERLAPLRLTVPGDVSSAAPFVVAATLLPGSKLRLHGVGLNPTRTGLPRRARAHGRAHRGLQPPLGRRRAGRRPRGRVGRADRDHDRRRRRCRALVDELPLFALAAGMARGDSVVRGAEELRVKESDRIESREGRAAAARHPHRDAGRTASGFAGCPPDPGAGASSTPAATTGSPCSGAVAGLVSREGVGAPGRRERRCKLPRLLRHARLARLSDDRRHRRPRRAGKSTVARGLAERLGFRYLDTGAMYRALTWLALEDGVDLDDGAALEALALGEPGRLRGRPRARPRPGRHRGDPARPRIDRVVSDGRPPPGGATRHARAPARARRGRRRRHRGSRHRHRRLPGRRGEGLPRRRPGRARAPAAGRPARDRRRGARHRPPPPRRARRRPDAGGAGRRRRSTRPGCPIDEVLDRIERLVEARAGA